MPAGRRRQRGVLITFEGIEGSGKSTQCARLAKRLREEGHRVLETREPGGTPLAERIRRLLLDTPTTGGPAEPIEPECEAYLILACRTQHVARVIRPALREGALVLCDRFSDSTLAYQGYARGLSLQVLERMNRLATGGLKPDLTLLFDVPVATGLRRRRHPEREQNRLDREARRFHERVRHGFLDLAEHDPQRIKVLDGTRDPDSIAAQVGLLIRRFLEKQHRLKVRRS